jgi:uncharacterized protein YcbK (DUF882 family)
MKTRITPDFCLEEFVCKCGKCNTPVEVELILRLQELRNQFGQPLKINSGARCEEHNKAVGGKPSSLHLLGKAADIKTSYMSKEERNRLLNLAKGMFNGIGVSDAFLHVDIRKKKATWSY